MVLLPRAKGLLDDPCWSAFVGELLGDGCTEVGTRGVAVGLPKLFPVGKCSFHRSTTSEDINNQLGFSILTGSVVRYSQKNVT